jgi:hypothetical protein
VRHAVYFSPSLFFSVSVNSSMRSKKIVVRTYNDFLQFFERSETDVELTGAFALKVDDRGVAI